MAEVRIMASGGNGLKPLADADLEDVAGGVCVGISYGCRCGCVGCDYDTKPQTSMHQVDSYIAIHVNNFHGMSFEDASSAGFIN